ncbi:MAG: hypothetical protein HY245_09495 [Rhizobiales bacterium]|nr:hypothetical protein [Hyphomicrobiales bacterium]MBI3673636.1 hypothetical protein [Hyphomicrobiales bacterium]
MLEDILLNIQAMIPSAPGQDALPTVLPFSYVCSGLGALILAKFTGSIGSLTVPVHFSALLIGALSANWLFRGLHLPIDQQLQQPMLVSLLGMLVAAIIMLWWLKPEGRPT